MNKLANTFYKGFKTTQRVAKCETRHQYLSKTVRDFVLFHFNAPGVPGRLYSNPKAIPNGAPGAFLDQFYY